MLYKFARFMLRLLFLVIGFRMVGQHHLPEKGGAIIAANHQSFLDPILLGIGMKRPVYFLARQELFEANRFFGWLIGSVHAVPLERRRFDSEGIRRTIRLLQAGHLFIVFPEGTRSFDGTVQPFKSGMILLAARSGVPIIPTRISGAFEIWPRTSLLPRRLHPTKVVCGVPVFVHGGYSAEAVCQEVYRQVKRLGNN